MMLSFNICHECCTHGSCRLRSPLDANRGEQNLHVPPARCQMLVKRGRAVSEGHPLSPQYMSLLKITLLFVMAVSKQYSGSLELELC